MKKLLLITLLASSNYAIAQIFPYHSIYGLDSCKFETSCNFVEIDTVNPNNLWQVGLPAKPFFDTAYSSPYAIMTDTINPYSTDNHSVFTFTSPTFWAPGNLLISFRHKFQTDSLKDGCYIETSFDLGQTWVNIVNNDTMSVGFHYENLYSKSDTISGGIPAYSGNSGDWIHTRLQWIFIFPLKKDPSDTLMLRFHFSSDSIQTNKDGWIIDDLNVSSVGLIGGLEEIKESELNIYPNPTTGQFTVQNAIGIIRVHDLYGRLVLETTNPQIDLSTYAPGMYFVRAGATTTKLILSK